MSATAALLFTRVQGAGFYRRYLQEAIELLPPDGGGTLLDVGCGPGLLARLAAARGYRATGIDPDAAMVAAARRLARREGSPAEYVRLGLFEALEATAPADVVAAASLLAVLPDRAAGLAALWRLVAPGGALLVVEATPRMTVARANDLIAAGLPGPRPRLLRLWARGRQGATVDPAIYDGLPDVDGCQITELLGGLVEARLLRKAVAQNEETGRHQSAAAPKEAIRPSPLAASPGPYRSAGGAPGGGSAPGSAASAGARAAGP